MGEYKCDNCGDRLIVQLHEGQLLSEQDLSVLEDYFSGPRIYKQGRDAVVWLAYWSPLTREPKTMRVAHYESLKVDDVEEDLEARANTLARRMFGVADVITTYTRSDNGQAWLTASCDFDEFEKRMTAR